MVTWLFGHVTRILGGDWCWQLCWRRLERGRRSWSYRNFPSFAKSFPYRFFFSGFHIIAFELGDASISCRVFAKIFFGDWSSGIGSALFRPVRYPLLIKFCKYVFKFTTKVPLLHPRVTKSGEWKLEGLADEASVAAVGLSCRTVMSIMVKYLCNALTI